MRYWYEKDGDKWVFCYDLDSETQEVVDQIMPEVVKEFRGDDK